jgi:hypothetical protein
VRRELFATSKGVALGALAGPVIRRQDHLQDRGAFTRTGTTSYPRENYPKRLPTRPRSADRTRLPVPVSHKREYFKYSPETIGDLSLEVTKFGVRRPN